MAFDGWVIWEEKYYGCLFKDCDVFQPEKSCWQPGIFCSLPAIIYIPAELFCTFRNKVSIWLQVCGVHVLLVIHTVCRHPHFNQSLIFLTGGHTEVTQTEWILRADN